MFEPGLSGITGCCGIVGIVSDCDGAGRSRGKSSDKGFCWEGRTRTCCARARIVGCSPKSAEKAINDDANIAARVAPMVRNLERLGAERTAIAVQASAGGLLVFVAEMRADNPCLQVLESPQVFDDIPAGVIEEEFAILGAPDRDNPFEIVAVFEQIIDGLGNAPTRNNRNLGTS
jgi:hypothetical protein